MNIPNVPTDNLYKFSAIFGLIMFVGAIYLYQASDKNIHDNEIRSKLSNIKRVDDSLNYENKIRLLELKSEFIVELENAPTTDMKSDKYYTKRSAELDEAFEDYFNAKNEYINSTNAGYKSDIDLLYYKSEQINYNLLADILSVSGILLIAWGFASWYFKHQIYMDAEIKWKGETFRQLIKEAKEIDTSKSETKDDAPIGEGS